MDIHAGGNLRCRRCQGSMPAGAEVSLPKVFVYMAYIRDSA